MDPQANDYYLLLSAVINNCNPLSLVSSELITKQSCFSPFWPLKKRKIILWNKNDFKWNVWWKSFQLSLTLLSSSVSQCMASAHKTVSEHLQWWACAVVYHQANFSLQWRGNVTYCASLFFSSSYLLTFHFMICILLLQNIVLTELRYPKCKRNSMKLL